MSAGKLINENSGKTTASALVCLGSFPLLGAAYTGFALGSLLGFEKALICLGFLALAAVLARVPRPVHLRAQAQFTRSAPARSLVGSALQDGVQILWVAAHVVLYVVVLRALCGDAWLPVLFAASLLACGTHWLARQCSALGSGAALLAFHPLCLGLIASCVVASTWPQLLTTTPPAGSATSAVVGGLWLALAALAAVSTDSAWGGFEAGARDWRLRLAFCLLFNVPATFLGILASASHYDVSGAGSSFVEALLWAVHNSSFCARWFVALACAAGLLTLMRKVSGFFEPGRRGVVDVGLRTQGTQRIHQT